jgi:hypothetical protein
MCLAPHTFAKWCITHTATAFVTHRSSLHRSHRHRKKTAEWADALHVSYSKGITMCKYDCWVATNSLLRFEALGWSALRADRSMRDIDGDGGSKEAASADKSTYWPGALARLTTLPHRCPSSHTTLLCLQQLVTRKSPLMRILLSSRLIRSRPPLYHGLKSRFCLFSSSQNRSHPRSFILSHQRSVTSCRLVSFLLIQPLQFVRNVGITHGDESRVGYYVGMMVCLKVILSVYLT